jgi:thiol-disulfide isomerase/thioredoxin
MKILKFYSDTCPPCKVLTEQLSKRDITHLDITEVNVKIDTELKTKYGVRRVPTIIQVSEDGEELKRFGGIEFIKFLDENPLFPIFEEPIEKIKNVKYVAGLDDYEEKIKTNWISKIKNIFK